MIEPAAVYRQAVAALNRGAWADAQSLAKRLLRLAPGHGGVWFVAGVAALRLQQLPTAVQYLARATTISPERADYATECARAFAMARMLREAVGMADRALALAPRDALMLDTLGVVYTQANEHAQAAEAFRAAVELDPGRASYRFNLATSLTFSGDMIAAEAQYEACIARAPGYWKAHLALSHLRRQTLESNHLPRLRAALEQARSDDDAELHLNLALAKEYEDLLDHARSFRHLVAGKQARRKTLGYSISRDQEIFDALPEVFAAMPVQPQGYESSEPIFVIGMPRSGTTMVERILSSHPSVHSGGELQNFSVVLKRASGSVTPFLLDLDTISRSRALDWRKLGSDYVASTRPGTGHTPYFIDKLPHNFLYAGHIATALPNAKIICLRRNPLDTCLGNFRQLFALTSPYYDYSFDLMDTGRYYLLFDGLMKRWHELFPGRILEIGYEDIVDRQEAVSRQLLEFCGLPWDDACLEFERNPLPVATASAVQVSDLAPEYRTPV